MPLNIYTKNEWVHEEWMGSRRMNGYMKNEWFHCNLNENYQWCFISQATTESSKGKYVRLLHNSYWQMSIIFSFESKTIHYSCSNFMSLYSKYSKSFRRHSNYYATDHVFLLDDIGGYYDSNGNLLFHSIWRRRRLLILSNILSNEIYSNDS